MMSSSRDSLLCLISCLGFSAGIAGLAGGTGLKGVSFLTWGTVLAGLVWVTGLTETAVSALGITILATFVLGGALYEWAADAFLILIIVAVVEVPQSGQLSLDATRRRPHFRQNGMCSLQLF